MLVYRIEHIITKRGPYLTNLNIPFVNKRHPTIYEEIQHNISECNSYYEFINKIDNNIRYGFNSINNLKLWFGRDIRRKLKKQNYIISVYNVPKKYVFSAEKQLIFACNFSTFNYHIDLSTLKRLRDV